MRIAYNPGEALSSVSSDDIIFDLAGKAIFAKGTRFDGKLHKVFEKASSDNTGGVDGLVPFPNYTALSNRFLREDGAWEVPYTPIQINGVPVQGDAETVMNLIPKDFIKLNLIGRDVEISTTYETATPEKDGLMSSGDKIKLDRLHYTNDENFFDGTLENAFNRISVGDNVISSYKDNQYVSFTPGPGINIFANTNDRSIEIKGIVMKGASEGEIGVTGLVPAPSNSDVNKFLRGDGVWENPYRHINVDGNNILGDNTIPLNLNSGDFIKLTPSEGSITISATYETATPEKNGLMSNDDKIKLDYLKYDVNSFSGNLTDAFTQVIAGGNTISSNSKNQSLSINQGLGITITSDTNSQSILIEGNIMTGATPDSVGVSGLVPAPSNSDINSFLKGDGTWGGYSLATKGNDGLMSKADKEKLDHLSYGPDFDGILDNAFNQVSAGGVTLESKNNQCLSISPGLGINITAEASSQTVSILGVVMTGANGGDGESGLVPKPSQGDSDKYLKGNGSWDDSIRHSINSDNATNADNADTVDGWHISVGSAGSEPNTIYFVL